MYTLNCIVFGDDPDSIFSVEIAQTQTISNLREAIKDVAQPHLNHVPAHHLKLWQIKLNDLHLLNTIGDEAVELKPLTELFEVFTDGAERGYIHVVVQRPAVARGGIMEDLADHIAELNEGEATPLGL
ncbi:hypothetical protein BDR04DRAFT_1038842 [Suillus decipiens]|nr:hypothetical protein BDR04DRAFT_1038842 [Suillus decipiens]